VRWDEIQNLLLKGDPKTGFAPVERFVENGPGTVLSGMLAQQKRVNSG
jgi:hypothetical protein